MLNYQRVAIEILKTTISFVDLPIDSMVIFHSFLYVYQRVRLVFPMETPNLGESKGNDV